MKKVVPKLQQEVKVKVDIATSDDIKIYYTGKFQDFTARYIIKIYRQWGWWDNFKMQNIKKFFFFFKSYVVLIERTLKSTHNIVFWKERMDLVSLFIWTFDFMFWVTACQTISFYEKGPMWLSDKVFDS